MKRFILPVIILILGVGILSQCEKDDICSESTPTTPKMVINFYEFLNPSVPKSVNKIEIFDIENPDVVLVFEAADQIQVPLRTDGDVSKYVFRLHYTNINQVLTNEDVIEIKYTTEHIYVSRACGYKSNFSLLESLPFELNPKVTDTAGDELWIKEYIVRQPNIENENETHLDILF